MAQAVGNRMNVSILVPFKSQGQPDRDANWDWIRRRFGALHPDWQISVGESQFPFNRGVAINDAAAKAKGDIFYISDADCFVLPEKARACVQMASEAPGAVIAATRWVALDRAYSMQLRQSVLNPEPVNPPAWCEVVGTVSGCLAISREGFEAVGGFPVEFEDWGGEDCAFWYKTETFLATGRRLEGDMYHLWHPTARDADSESFKRNMKRQELYGQANLKPDEMRALIG